MLLYLPNQVKEFLAAIAKPYSYNFSKNLYIWFGFLWGLPIPIVTLFMQAYFDQELTIGELGTILSTSPLQWFFLAHPPVFAILLGILGTVRHEKEKKVNQLVEELKTLSVSDSLTGLKNRRYFAHAFHDECARAHRRAEPLALLFVDLDHFKKVNDTYGHHIGDIVLKETAQYLSKNCRPYDTLARWGGEEFILLLRGADEQTAFDFSDRIRVEIEHNIHNTTSVAVTVSIGVAQHQTDDTLESLTDRADQALYHAKATGRNKVVAWSVYQQEIQEGSHTPTTNL